MTFVKTQNAFVNPYIFMTFKNGSLTLHGKFLVVIFDR